MMYITNNELIKTDKRIKVSKTLCNFYWFIKLKKFWWSQPVMYTVKVVIFGNCARYRYSHFFLQITNYGQIKSAKSDDLDWLSRSFIQAFSFGFFVHLWNSRPDFCWHRASHCLGSPMVKWKLCKLDRNLILSYPKITSCSHAVTMNGAKQ